MDGSDLNAIWARDILPSIKEHSTSTAKPITVFLGGQPAAGKTLSQRRLVKAYDGRLLSIIGDDFRRHHPDYDRLLTEGPLSMPRVTAKAAGYWTGRTVEYADSHHVSCIIEGTWRNAPTVLDEAARAKRLKRRTHAVMLAVPPVLSRLGLLYRFYRDLDKGDSARWTPPRAHEDTVAALPANVHAVAMSGLFDRLSVMDRSGAFLYDGDDSGLFERIWRDRFTEGLDADEKRLAERDLDYIESVRRALGVGAEESEPVLEAIRADLGVRDYIIELEEPDALPPARRSQPREPKGTPYGGRWKR